MVLLEQRYSAGPDGSLLNLLLCVYVLWASGDKPARPASDHTLARAAPGVISGRNPAELLPVNKEMWSLASVAEEVEVIFTAYHRGDSP